MSVYISMCMHISLTKSKDDIEKKSKMIFNYPDSFESYFHFNGWENKNLVIAKQDDPELLELATWGLLPTEYDINKRKDFLIKTNTLNATKERLFKSNLYRLILLFDRRCPWLAFLRFLLIVISPTLLDLQNYKSMPSPKSEWKRTTITQII